MNESQPKSAAPAPRKSREIVGLDLIRFAAAAMVMFFHLGFWQWAAPLTRTNRLVAMNLPFPQLGHIAANGWVGVEIFFVISGFVIAWSAEKASFSGFLRSRFLRLAPAAWICSTLSGLALLASGAPPRILLLAYAKTITFFPNPPWIDDAYWTLDVEISFYALVALLIAAGRRSLLIGLVGFIGALSATFWIVHIGLGANPSWATAAARSRVADLALLHHGCFFCIGVIVWRTMEAGRLPLVWAGLCALCILGGALEIVDCAAGKTEVTGLVASATIPVVVWLAALAAIVVSIRANAHLTSIGRRLRTRAIGLATYPLYLLHTVIGGLTTKALVTAGVSPPLALVGGFATALIAALIVSVWLEPQFRRVLPTMPWGSRVQTSSPKLGEDFA